MGTIRVAIAGIGNCASSLVQGIEYYRRRNDDEYIGLMHPRIGEWSCDEIDVVAAFDIDRRKVGRPLEEAVFAAPNCTRIFQSTLPVFLSRAMTNCSVRPSQLKIKASPTTIGEPPLPHPGSNWMSRFRQTILPARSRQAVPWWPK